MANKKKINFSAGPGKLPDQIHDLLSVALIEEPETGLPLLGISHRSEWFKGVIAEAKRLIVDLLSVPDDYHILFLQGGSSLQFYQIPLSFGHLPGLPEYIVSGYWSRKALEATKDAFILWQGKNRMPDDEELDYSESAPYFHYVSNETVDGNQVHRVLGLNGVIRICDMSSDFLTRPFDVSRFDLIYTHAQKNLGPAGVTIVVIKDSLLYLLPDDLPPMLDYRCHVEKDSMYNTPPVFAIYATMLCLRWLRDAVGGMEEMNAINQIKSNLLYDFIDNSEGFYSNSVRKQDRSLINVVFDLADPLLLKEFVRMSEDAGLAGLKGHRSRGGLRASLYNAVTVEDVDTLCGFLDYFKEKNNGK